MKFISAKAHTIMGLVVGAVLLFAPTLFNFVDNTAATAVAQLVGIFVILSELITTSPVSILKMIPVRAHIILDCITGVFLLTSPWLFGFANSPVAEWAPHFAVGILIVSYALITNSAHSVGTEKAMIAR
jgi:hypothetical protein